MEPQKAEPDVGLQAGGRGSLQKWPHFPVKLLSTCPLGCRPRIQEKEPLELPRLVWPQCSQFLTPNASPHLTEDTTVCDGLKIRTRHPRRWRKEPLLGGLPLPAPSSERELWAVGHVLRTPVVGAHSTSVSGAKGLWRATGSLTLGIDVSTRHARDVQLPQVLANAILCNKKHVLEITGQKSRDHRETDRLRGREGARRSLGPVFQDGVCPSPLHPHSPARPSSCV